MKLEEILKRLKKLPYFSRLEFIYLYGSAASGKKTERSDIDICLYYSIKDRQKLHKLLFKIKGTFPDNYDIQIFNLLLLIMQQ